MYISMYIRITHEHMYIRMCILLSLYSIHVKTIRGNGDTFNIDWMISSNPWIMPWSIE